MTLNETVRRFMMAKQELSECNGIFNSMVKDLFSDCSCTWGFRNIDFNDDGTCMLEVVWYHRGVGDEYTLESVPSDILQEYFTGSKETAVKKFQEWRKETGALED